MHDSQVRPISSISKLNDVELAVDDDDKSFRSFLLLLRMRHRTLSVKESPASEAMGVRARELDSDMQGGGAHVTHTGAHVLGQMAGPWAYP